MDKEKIVQIYEATADMTLKMIDARKKNTLYLEEDELEMIRTTQSLYETVNCTNHPAVVTAFEGFVLNCSKSQYGCKYTDRPEANYEVGLNPLNCQSSCGNAPKVS